MNRVPSRRLNGDTPYKRLMGKHAKVDNLRVFGCLVYVHTQVRSKLDDKAWKGIMVGYDDHNTRCYRIFDPIRRVASC